MIITSKRALLAIKDNNDDTIYFVKYNFEWNNKREFRVFIYKGKVTCISQYSSYDKSVFSGQSTAKIKDNVRKIADWLEGEILPTVCARINTLNVTADIYFDEVRSESCLKIIELNSFGYWLAAGSSLFHWLKDKSKLYNENSDIWVRIIK